MTEVLGSSAGEAHASGAAEPGLQWRTPDRRLLGLRRWQVRVSAALLLAGSGISAAFFPVPGLIALGAVVVAYVCAEVTILRRFGAWGYAERAEDLLVRRGVLVRRLSVVPYGRMQFVDVVAGPLERRWGLATVRLHTAAAASDARVPGLPTAEAERLRDRLAMLGESRAAGL
ncbi:MAG TPA: PH domain-containing protein [Frankiaceae bacterium]|nr:PH domain-containing protein [Frankiaceae bacterium]